MDTKARYSRYANAIVLIHFGWTLLLLGGTIFMLFNPAYAAIQIGIMSLTILAWIPFKMRCPLTVWEHHVRRKLGDKSVEKREPFMVAYISKLLGRKVKRRTVSLATAFFYVMSYILSISILSGLKF